MNQRETSCRNDPDAAALEVAYSYFSNRLFTYVRGQGLAYGAWLTGSIKSGIITYELYRYTQNAFICRY